MTNFPNQSEDKENGHKLKHNEEATRIIGDAAEERRTEETKREKRNVGAAFSGDSRHQ